MSIITWTNDFVTGLGFVDRQHRRLVVLINRLGVALAANPRSDDLAVTYAYERLLDHAASHFSDEERLMLNAGIDGRHCEIHRQAHVHLIELIASLWRARAGMSNPAEALLDVVVPWFVQHTLSMDMSMALQIRLLRRGESAERSYDLASTAEPSKADATLGALRQLFEAVSRRNLALEQRVCERTEELERVNVALTEANQRLSHQDGDLENQIRARTQKLERANRALTAANHRLKDIANTDALLGIANRTSFDERLAAEWRRARRDTLPLSLLMIDVDHFKHFNDTYGHPAGDRCLQSIAQAVATMVHRPGDFVARYGGEELVVLLPNTDMHGARKCGEQLCKRVRSMDIAHPNSGGDSRVTVSIGASCGLQGYNAASAAELLNQADQALYRAKFEGRNRVCCFRDEVGGTADGEFFRAQKSLAPALLTTSAVKKSVRAFARQ